MDYDKLLAAARAYTKAYRELQDFYDSRRLDDEVFDHLVENETEARDELIKLLEETDEDTHHHTPAG